MPGMGLTTSVVNKLAFIPPTPQYEAGDVTHWVRTRFGNKLPVCVYRHTKCDFRSRFRLHFYHSTGDLLRFQVAQVHYSLFTWQRGGPRTVHVLLSLAQRNPAGRAFCTALDAHRRVPRLNTRLSPELRALLLRPLLLNGRAPCDRPCTLRST